MFLLNICEDGNVLKAIQITLTILNIIRIVVPLLIIIFGMKDFFGVISTDKTEEKIKDAWHMLVRRTIAGLVVLFIPNILHTAMNLVGAQGTAYEVCITESTPEGIRNAYYKKAKGLVDEAKSALDANKAADARAYLNNVEDTTKRKELEKELDRIDEYITLYNEISGMNETKKYDELKSKINQVSDSSVKATLLKHLEERKKIAEDKERQKEVYEKEKEKERQQQQQQQQNLNLGGTVIKKEESDTLKVTISKKDSYYLTQIWVKDPYNQLNKYDSPQYGSNLYKPSVLLNQAISRDNLQGKMVIGFNASGFYLKDTYDAASVNYYPQYDKTSVGTLVITNGQVIRNAYDKAYKTWFIAGVDQSGLLRIYVDERTSNIDAKKQWSESVIGSIRNTFTFASPLVENGQGSTTITSMPAASSKVNRQAMCQIDTNNFLLITGSNLSRADLIRIMTSANCQTGTNFDGGGSIALLYKNKNSNTVETIIGNGRAVTEVGYFSE